MTASPLRCRSAQPERSISTGVRPRSGPAFAGQGPARPQRTGEGQPRGLGAPNTHQIALPQAMIFYRMARQEPARGGNNRSSWRQSPWSASCTTAADTRGCRPTFCRTRKIAGSNPAPAGPCEGPGQRPGPRRSREGVRWSASARFGDQYGELPCGSAATHSRSCECPRRASPPSCSGCSRDLRWRQAHSDPQLQPVDEGRRGADRRAGRAPTSRHADLPPAATRPDRLSDDELRRISGPVLLMLAAESRIIDSAKAKARVRQFLLVFQEPAAIVERILLFVEAARRPEP